MIHVSQEVFPSASVNNDDFSHCENVVSHMIEPSYGRNLKSKVFSSWATCYMRQCVDNTVVGIGRFYTRRRIIRLDELGQTFVVGRIMRL